MRGLASAAFVTAEPGTSLHAAGTQGSLLMTVDMMDCISMPLPRLPPNIPDEPGCPVASPLSPPGQHFNLF